MRASTANAIKGRAPLRASAELRGAIKRRGGHVGTISHIYSAKTDTDLVVTSDLELAHLLHLEADSDVKWFETDIDRIVAHLDGVGYIGTKPDARVVYRSGEVGLVEVKYAKDLEDDIRTQLQVAAQKKYAADIGASWTAYTEKEAAFEGRVLHDWIKVIVVLSETRGKIRPSLESDVLNLVEDKSVQSLLQISNEKFDSWDFTFSAIFRLIQSGKLLSDLNANPISWRTTVRPWL